jgi:predicted transposase YbfD/YdcC
MITVGENFTDMEDFGNLKFKWLKTFLELPSDIPSHDTFNRVFSAIDPEVFLECFIEWVAGICTSLDNEIVAIDGKALRGSLNKGESIPYIVSAWAVRNGLTLGQIKVDEKSNEITAIPKLLEVLELKGCIVTIDAMGCQKSIAANIIDAKADFVLALKGNHSLVHEEFVDYFEELVPEGAGKNYPLPEGMAFYETVEKGHGRIETRRYWHTEDIDWFADKDLWKGLKSVGMVESTREIGEKISTERRLFLSSFKPDAKRFAGAVRGHWGVENNLHWSLDVTFGEDQSRARDKNAAQNLATMRRIIINILKKEETKEISMRRKKNIAALDEDYLKLLLGII